MPDASRLQPLAPRAHFPLLDELTYLSIASIGLVPLPVQEQANAFDREITTRGTTWFDEEQETGVLERARVVGAKLLGVDPGTVTIPNSATTMLCEAAWSVRPQAGENIVAVDIDFPSTTYPWLRVAEDTGAEVRLTDAHDNPASLDMASIERLVDENTAVIAVSHVQYATGAILDLGRLSELARAHDAALVVDATQSLGMVPIDLTETPVDFLVAAGYKRLCGPFGAAIAYVSPERLETFKPIMVGWRSTPDPYTMDARELKLASEARRAEFSTMSYTAGLALGAAAEYVNDLGIAAILEHGRDLADLLIAGLDDLGAQVISPRERELRGGTVTARFGDRDGEEVAGELNSRGVMVSPRFGSTRFSLGFFNGPQDVGAALSTLGEVLDA